MEEAEWRCCHAECIAAHRGGLPPGWYRVFWGFMLRACPLHAAEWCAFDQRVRERELALGAAYAAAFADFERAFAERAEREFPPLHPPDR